MEELSLSIVIAQIINFWIVFSIFYYFLWEKIVKIIEDRRLKLENLDNSDEVVKEKMDAAEKEANELLENSRSKALEIQRNAEDLSKKNTKQKIDEAEVKAEAIISWAQRDLEKEKLWMINAMKGKILDLSLKINSKVFDKKDANKEFIEKEVKLCFDKTS